jgi:hypothetical protein
MMSQEHTYYLAVEKLTKTFCLMKNFPSIFQLPYQPIGELNVWDTCGMTMSHVHDELSAGKQKLKHQQ